jgi:signal recognition particle subunit SRP54
MDALDNFDPARIAGRILGMGDIVALVEKAAANIDAEKMRRQAERLRKGAFDLGDLREQLMQMQKMGGMGGLLGLMPGIAKMKNQIQNAGLDDGLLKRQIAIIDSMTPKERRNPDLLKASRKKRIAAGSGTSPEQINKLLKMHRGMADMMKMMGGKAGNRGPLAGLAQAMGLGGGMPSQEQLAELAKQVPGGLPGPGAPGLPPGMPGLPKGLPPNFPGLPGGGKFPGLPGLPGGGKKK